MQQFDENRKVILNRGNLRTVSFGISIPIGSADEIVPGISSILVNHLQRNTSKMGEDEYADFIDNHGITTFGSANRTNLSLGLTSPPQHVDKAINLLSEMIFEPDFKQESLTQLIQSQVGSLQQIQSNPESILSEYTRWNSVYDTDKITQHPLGDPQSLQEINVDIISKWHQDVIQYNPYIAVVGIDVSEPKLNEIGLDSFLQQFGKKDMLNTPITKHSEQLRIKNDKPVMESANAYIGVNIRGKDPRESKMEEDLYRAIIYSGNTSRLFTEIREKRNLSYAPYVLASNFRNGSFMTAMMDVRPDRAEEALETTLNVLHGAMTDEISDVELSRSVKGALKVAVFVADSSTNYVSFLLSRMTTGREYDLDKIKAKLTELSKENWQEKIRELWTRENLSFSVSGEAGTVADNWLEIVEKVI